MAADEVILLFSFKRLNHRSTKVFRRHGGLLTLNTVVGSAKIFVGTDELSNLRFEVGELRLEGRNNFRLLNCVDDRVFATGVGGHFFEGGLVMIHHFHG